ncbi:MAG: hypothetical protein ACRD96_26520 [Bryobacteraceae bacterium]
MRIRGFAGKLRGVVVWCAAAAALIQSQELPGRRAAEEDLRRLHQTMQEFVEAWNDFTAEYIARGTFNARKVKRVREAWTSLERMDPAFARRKHAEACPTADPR